MRRPRLLALPALLFGLVACGGGGGDADAGLADAGLIDAGLPDGAGDAPVVDAGSTVGTEADPGASCLDILTRGGSTGDGVYFIELAASAGAFRVRCDMTGDAGGWTLVASYPLGTTTTPANWSTALAEGTEFFDPATVFKLADVAVNELSTTGYRVHAAASACLGPVACALDHVLYFGPTCTFSSTDTSTECSTAYLDASLATLTTVGAAPDPCPQHGGLVDYQCGLRGGVVTNHDPAFGGAGIFLCVGELATDTRACVPRGAERAGVQIWVR